MITLGQYIKVTDTLLGVNLNEQSTATDLFISNPEVVYSVLEILGDKPLEALMAQETLATIGQFDICISKLTQLPPYEVPFFQVGGKVFTSTEPLLKQMAKDNIPYGEISFGGCLEVFSLLDQATHKHRAIPMIIAHLYHDEEKTHPIKKAKLFLDMDFQDALSIFFFFASLGIGYTKHISSLPVATTAAKPTKKQLRQAEKR